MAKTFVTTNDCVRGRKLPLLSLGTVTAIEMPLDAELRGQVLPDRDAGLAFRVSKRPRGPTIAADHRRDRARRGSMPLTITSLPVELRSVVTSACSKSTGDASATPGVVADRPQQRVAVA